MSQKKKTRKMYWWTDQNGELYFLCDEGPRGSMFEASVFRG